MLKRVWFGAFYSALLIATLLCVRIAEADGQGQLAACICTKGQFREPTDLAGMRALAETAHRYGFPVTWIIKPFTARDMATELEKWHRDFGDEVAWYSEGTALSAAEEELRALRDAAKWQQVLSTGTTKYDASWVKLYERLGIESVWGRCYEQTDADHICDRGSPYGFYYLHPDCYKAPNTAAGGLVSVPWLSNDPNLVFRCGFQSSFTFDPDDPMSMGFIGPGRCEYWFALVDELQKQTRYNAFVPLIIQQEYPSGGLRDTLPVLDELFAYLKRKNIPAVSQAEAVRRYRKACPEHTPPTYAVFDNLGKIDVVQHPLPSARYRFEVVTNRLSTAFMGAPFNGYYTTDWQKETGKRLYYHPEGKRFFEHGRLFVYYDVNGLLLFEEGRAAPIRITNYLEIPPHSHGYTTLPELSYFYGNERFIPDVQVEQKIRGSDLSVTVTVSAPQANPVAQIRLPYGVMVWGDFSNYRLPENAFAGAAIVGEAGLFLPLVLDVGQPAERAVKLRAK